MDNNERAARAQEALELDPDYRSGGNSTKEAVGDLLANLMHLCKQEDIDFADQLLMANINFNCEAQASEDYTRGRKGDGLYFVLSYDQGRDIEQVLRRYIGEELQPKIDEAALLIAEEDVERIKADVQKDIDYINGLIAYFKREGDNNSNNG
jgi:hypothetical protein